MGRLAGKIAYKGTNFSGWQKQPNAQTVQEILELSLSIFYREEIQVVGCGRTDAGVHASNYIFHFEMESPCHSDHIQRINAILPDDVALHNLIEVNDDFHARFSAESRLYRYYLHGLKDPFGIKESTYFPRLNYLDQSIMHDASDLIKTYGEFFPFCKSNSGVEHYKCQMLTSQWKFEEGKAIYTVKANRFLRGMVRMLVGAQINLGLGVISMEDLRSSMDNQTILPRSLSMPPEGLFLEEISYSNLRI